MADNVIIEKIKRKDEHGFSMLINQYSAYITAIISNFSRGALKLEDIEEVAADVFISVWNSGDKLRDSSTLKPYLAQIARNATISRLRKSGYNTVSFDDDILIVSKDGLPDEITIQREQKEIVNEAVESFGEPEREIFIRYYFFGEKVNAIAQRLNLNPATIKTKLHRGRKRIKSLFEERGYRNGVEN